MSPPHVSERERELLLEAFDSNYIAPVGPALDAFEESFREQTGFAHCVAVTSGTAALHLALVHLGIQSGDTVIASTLTFIGSVGPRFSSWCEADIRGFVRRYLEHGSSLAPASFGRVQIGRKSPQSNPSYRHLRAKL